jgi:hypothetical protein
MPAPEQARHQDNWADALRTPPSMAPATPEAPPAPTKPDTTPAPAPTKPHPAPNPNEQPGPRPDKEPSRCPMPGC